MDGRFVCAVRAKFMECPRESIFFFSVKARVIFNLVRWKENASVR